MDRVSATRFLDRLLLHPRGRIILCNIIDGLDGGVFDEDIVRQLFDWWSTLFLERVKRSYAGRLPKVREEKELIDSLDLVLFERQAPWLRPNDNKPDFLLMCMRRPGNATMHIEFVNITQASGFIYLLLHENECRTLAATGGLAITDYPPGNEVLALVSRGSHVVRLKPASTVGRLGRVLWLTPLNQIESDLPKGGPANVVRDRLGLIRYNNVDEALVALHLPDNVIEQIRNARPTAADAGSHARFKARADTAAMRRRRAWGYTVDLERFAGGKRNIDGLPERVCQPIPSGHLGNLRITPLRPVTIIRGNTPEDNHEAFAIRLTRQHIGVDNIRNVLYISMASKNSKTVNEGYELIDGDDGPFSGFDKVQFESWLRVGLEGYCLENKGAWAFPGAEAAIARQDYLALGLRDAYHELDAEARAHFRHAVANVIASLEAKESNVPIIEHLLLLASVIHASEILRVLPARVGNGFFGLTKNREGESLFGITLLTVAQLAAPRLEAVDCLRALIASRHFDNAYAGIALSALCHADDKDLVGHMKLLREALADMFREFITPERYKRELARTVLDAVGLRNVVQALPRLEYIDLHNEHAPLDTWFFRACVGGKSPLLGRDETDVRHIYFYRPSKPSVREPLPEVAEGLGDFIALLRDPTHEEPTIPIPLPMSMASPRGAVTSHDRRRLFNQLKEQWERETANVSSVTGIILNDAYQRIIGMGPTALPMIFSALKEEGGLWFPALKSITGADPVPEHERGNMEAMRQSWFDWATRHGYL